LICYIARYKGLPFHPRLSTSVSFRRSVCVCLSASVRLLFCYRGWLLDYIIYIY